MTDVATDFIGNRTLRKEICQTLQEIKKYGRSAENHAEALLALADSESAKMILQGIAGQGKLISDQATKLYNSLAREAFDE